MKRILSYVLTMIMALTLVNVNVLATEAVPEKNIYIGETGYDTLTAAIDAVEPDGTIQIIGEVGSKAEYTVYTITRSDFTIKGSEGSKIYGTLIIRGNNVTIDGLHIENKGDVGTTSTQNRAAIYLWAESGTIINNTFTNGLGEQDGLANGLQLGRSSTNLNEDASVYKVEGNTFNGYEQGVSDWVSAAFLVVEGYSSGAAGGYYQPINVDDYAFATKNTFINNKIDYVNNDYLSNSNKLGLIKYRYLSHVNVLESDLEDIIAGGTLLLAKKDYHLENVLNVIRDVTIQGISNDAVILVPENLDNAVFEVEAGVTLTLKDIHFHSDEHAFMGLFSDKEFENEVSFPFTANKKTSIYAKWADVYTVNFYDGEQKINTEFVLKDVKLTAPISLGKEGYTLDGWYKEATFKNKWDFEKDVVTDATDLYAKWNINSYKVTFKDHDDKVIGEVQTIEHGKGALKPKDPVREGYTFKGWDKAFDKVTGDLIVKAEYLANPKAEVEADKKEIEVEVKGLDDAVTFTEAERQNEVGVKLEVSVLEEKDVPKADQKLIDDFIKETLKVEDAKVLVLDISLFKVVGKETSAVHDANKPITISFKLPEAYVGLEFEILRVHDGKVEKLKYDYDEKTQMVSFETDKFSTYAVAAKSADEEKKPEDKLPGMGDNSHAGWLFLLAGGLLLIASKRKGFARK